MDEIKSESMEGSSEEFMTFHSTTSNAGRESESGYNNSESERSHKMNRNNSSESGRGSKRETLSMQSLCSEFASMPETGSETSGEAATWIEDTARYMLRKAGIHNYYRTQFKQHTQKSSISPRPLGTSLSPYASHPALLYLHTMVTQRDAQKKGIQLVELGAYIYYQLIGGHSLGGNWQKIALDLTNGHLFCHFINLINMGRIRDIQTHIDSPQHGYNNFLKYFSAARELGVDEKYEFDIELFVKSRSNKRKVVVHLLHLFRAVSNRHPELNFPIFSPNPEELFESIEEFDLICSALKGTSLNSTINSPQESPTYNLDYIPYFPSFLSKSEEIEIIPNVEETECNINGSLEGILFMKRKSNLQRKSSKYAYNNRLKEIQKEREKLQLKAEHDIYDQTFMQGKLGLSNTKPHKKHNMGKSSKICGKLHIEDFDDYLMEINDLKRKNEGYGKKIFDLKTETHILKQIIKTHDDILKQFKFDISVIINDRVLKDTYSRVIKMNKSNIKDILAQSKKLRGFLKELKLHMGEASDEIEVAEMGRNVELELEYKRGGEELTTESILHLGGGSEGEGDGELFHSNHNEQEAKDSISSEKVIYSSHQSENKYATTSSQGNKQRRELTRLPSLISQTLLQSMHPSQQVFMEDSTQTEGMQSQREVGVQATLFAHLEKGESDSESDDTETDFNLTGSQKNREDNINSINGIKTIIQEKNIPQNVSLNSETELVSETELNIAEDPGNLITKDIDNIHTDSSSNIYKERIGELEKEGKKLRGKIEFLGEEKEKLENLLKKSGVDYNEDLFMDSEGFDQTDYILAMNKLKKENIELNDSKQKIQQENTKLKTDFADLTIKYSKLKNFSE